MRQEHVRSGSERADSRDVVSEARPKYNLAVTSRVTSGESHARDLTCENNLPVHALIIARQAALMKLV